jgi:HEAT repeat protein
VRASEGSALRFALGDPDVLARARAGSALVGLGGRGEALPVLAALLRSPDAAGRKTAADTLGERRRRGVTVAAVG